MNHFQKQIPSIEDFSTPYFFFSSDSDGVITYVSGSVQNILGYRPVEIVGRQFHEFAKAGEAINEDLEVCLEERFRNQFAGKNQRLRAVRDRQGRRRVISVQTIGRLGEDGKVAAVHGLAQEVTTAFETAFRLWNRLQELKTLEAKLSKREKEVLEMMVQGKLNKTIAKILGVTERTIENVRARLKSKLQVNSIAEVAAVATELRILPEVVERLCPAEEWNCGDDAELQAHAKMPHIFRRSSQRSEFDSPLNNN